MVHCVLLTGRCPASWKIKKRKGQQHLISSFDYYVGRHYTTNFPLGKSSRSYPECSANVITGACLTSGENPGYAYEPNYDTFAVSSYALSSEHQRVLTAFAFETVV